MAGQPAAGQGQRQQQRQTNSSTNSRGGNTGSDGLWRRQQQVSRRHCLLETTSNSSHAGLPGTPGSLLKAMAAGSTPPIAQSTNAAWNPTWRSSSVRQRQNRQQGRVQVHVESSP